MESYEGQTKAEGGSAVDKKFRKQTCLSVQSNRTTCAMCSQPHRLDHCSRFKAMKLQDRHDFVKRKRLCFNCFFAHSVRDCRPPPCQHCQRLHHSLLHGLPYQGQKPVSTCSPIDSVISAVIVDDKQPTTPADKAGASTDIGAMALHSTICNVQPVSLSTAVIVVQGKHGRRFPCRAVLDNGSQINIMTQKLSKKLGVDVTRTMLPISGVNGVNTRSSQWVNVTISSSHSQYTNVIDFHVLPAITFPLPAQSIKTENWEFPDAVKISLADPGFNCTADVDLLLGAEIYYEKVWLQPTVMPGGLP